jgi:hypothetical protein
LKGEFLLLQQFANDRMADLVAELFQFARQPAQGKRPLEPTFIGWG